MKRLLFLSDIPWHSLYQRPQHIATRLAREYELLWIEPVTLSSKVQFAPIRQQERIHVLSLPLFPHNARQKWIRTLSHVLSSISLLRFMLLQWQLFLLNRAMKKLGWDPDGLFCVMENFQLIDLAERVQPTRVLFDYIDDAFGFVDFPSYVRRDWKKAIHRADTIVATTEKLATLIRDERKIDVQIISNGVDYKFFSDRVAGRPANLPASPVVGYVGSVAVWFDFELLERCLRHFPNVNFVLIGREQPAVASRVTSLKSYTNFSFLGFVPYTELPPFVQQFSVGIIPFRKNTLTAAVNPVKLYEYCAAGIPTVTTDFAEDLLQFEDRIFISRSADQFVEHLAQALIRSQDEKYRSALREFAKNNDWNARAERISEILSS